MKRVFFDTETTGLHPGQIAQLAVIIEDDNNGISTKNYFFDIDYMTKGAEEVCGRCIEFYREASKGKKFINYKDEILELFSDATLIAHNLKFDENFLSMELWRQGITFTPKDRFDTMEFFRDICKLPDKRSTSRYKNPKLEELVNYFNIDKNKVEKYSIQLFGNNDLTNSGFHDARYDTTAMYVVFQIHRDSLFGKNNWKREFQVQQ